MDDVMKRLGVLERDMSDLKVQVGSIAAQLPHLATKAEIGDLKAMASAEIGDLKAAISDAKTSSGWSGPRSPPPASHSRSRSWFISGGRLRTGGGWFSVCSKGDQDAPSWALSAWVGRVPLTMWLILRGQ